MIVVCATSTSARCAGPTWTCSVTSTTWCTSTTCRKRASTCCACTQPARHDHHEATRHRRGRRRGQPRGDLPAAADLHASSRCSIECWVTEIRAASFTIAYEIFRTTGRRRRAGGVRASVDRADAVRLRRRAPAADHPGGAHPARALLRARRAVAADQRSWWPQSKVGHYPVHVRFSDVDVYGHVNNVKYFEYFQEARLLLHRPALARRAGGLLARQHRGGADRRRLQAGDPVPGGALRLLDRGHPRRHQVVHDGVRDLRRRPGALPRPGGRSCSSTSRPASSAEPPAVYRDPLVAAVASSPPR